MVKSESCASSRYVAMAALKMSIVVGSGVLLRSSLLSAAPTVVEVDEMSLFVVSLKNSAREEERRSWCTRT